MLLEDSQVHKSSKHCLKPLVAPDGVTSELLGNEVQSHSLRSNQNVTSSQKLFQFPWEEPVYMCMGVLIVHP